MSPVDGEIPAVWFLITSVGFIFLSYIQFKNHGKTIETIFLSILAILFFISYFILVFKAWVIPTINKFKKINQKSIKKWYDLKVLFDMI